MYSLEIPLDECQMVLKRTISIRSQKVNAALIVPSTEEVSKATDTTSRSKNPQISASLNRTDLPVPKGPRSMFPTRGEDVLTGCNIIPIGHHPPISQTRSIEVQIPIRKERQVPRWHVGHSDWQRRRELVSQCLLINPAFLTDMRN